jgi:N-acetylglutamate synthase-like GNAT family acetyltransferase
MQSARTQVSLREPVTSEDFEQYYALRWKVLREPWDQPRESEKDEFEADAIHLMAWADDALVGVGRLHFNSSTEAQVRYMAVHEDRRNRGVGAEILRELEKRAAERGAKSIVLNARDRAVHFYEQHGYRIIGKASSLFGSVDHFAMQKDLR